MEKKLAGMVILLFVCLCFSVSVFVEKYSDAENDSANIYFFPVDKAFWDGSKITSKNWQRLNSIQKMKFVIEGMYEIERAKDVIVRRPVNIQGVVSSLDNLVLIFSLAERKAPVLDLLFEVLEREGFIEDKKALNTNVEIVNWNLLCPKE